MEVIFGNLLSTLGVPVGLLTFLILSVSKGWLVPGRFYDDQKAAADKWQQTSTEQREIITTLTSAVEDLNKGVGAATTHFFTSLNQKLNEHIKEDPNSRKGSEE